MDKEDKNASKFSEEALQLLLNEIKISWLNSDVSVRGFVEEICKLPNEKISNTEELLNEEELQELLDKIKIKWLNGDPAVCDFVEEIHRLRNKKISHVEELIKELTVKLIAECLKRMSGP